MTYDPATYWPARYHREGATYVAKGGRIASWHEQIKAIRPHFDHLPSTGRVLDFGCGPQRFRPALEARGLDYEGIDLIPGLGTMEAADVEPGSFDAAVAIFVLQHIVDAADYDRAVALLHAALRPGGVLLVVDHVPITPSGGWADHMHPRGPTNLCGYGFRGPKITGSVDGHWIGRFVR